MNFSPSWSALETSIGFEFTATVVDGVCRGLCGLCLGRSCWMVDWSAEAVAVVNADAAILSLGDSAVSSPFFILPPLDWWAKRIRLWLSVFVGARVVVCVKRAKIVIEILYAMWDFRNHFDVVARTLTAVASLPRRHSIKFFDSNLILKLELLLLSSHRRRRWWRCGRVCFVSRRRYRMNIFTLPR